MLLTGSGTTTSGGADKMNNDKAAQLRGRGGTSSGGSGKDLQLSLLDASSSGAASGSSTAASAAAAASQRAFLPSDYESSPELAAAAAAALAALPPVRTFKSSLAKKDQALKYCATNLHVQLLALAASVASEWGGEPVSSSNCTYLCMFRSTVVRREPL